MANYQTLFFDMAAGQTVTSWFRVLGTNAKNTRAVTGTLTSGDTVTVQMTNEVLNSEKNILSTDVSTSNYAASPAQTATVFEFGYDGNFKWVRCVKTGSAGAARIAVEC